MRLLRLDADWSQAEEREDDEGDDDEGQLKAREWQVHLHNYLTQSTFLHYVTAAGCDKT